MDGINRLRDWLKGRLLMGNGWNELNEIADAIESEVKADRVYAYIEGYDAGFASADDWVAQHEDAMAEHGWVRLPVDADGVPIHVGDVMEWDQGGNVFTVTALHLVSREWEVWGDDAEYAPDECRHHHAPTVEDVLREFMTKAEDIGDYEVSEDALIAEYAARLRLAGDGE